MLTAAAVIGQQSIFAADFHFRTRAYQDWVTLVDRDPAGAPSWPEFRDQHPTNQQRTRPSTAPTGGHATQSAWAS